MKKVLALTLVLVLAISMSTTAFALTATKVINDKETAFDYSTVANRAGGSLLDGDGRTPEYIDLRIADFIARGDAKDTAVNSYVNYVGATSGTTIDAAFMANTNISKEFVRQNRLEAKIKWVKGAAVFDGASITDAGEIKLAYKGAITSIKNIAYQYQVLMSINGRVIQDKDAWITVDGEYKPDENDGYWSDNWFKFTGRNYVTPDAYVRNMEYVLNDDEDVTVWGRALKGVKYYGHVDNSWNPSDEKVSIDHPEIVGVYHVEQINLKTVTDHVTFNNDDGELYVYNKDLQLLGQVKDKITSLEDTYYLASAQLDVDTEEPDDLGDDDDDYEPDDWGGNSGTGGDDLYPENPHDNPGTGK